MSRRERLRIRRTRTRMRIVAIAVVLGSLGVGSAALATGKDPTVGNGPGGSGPPGHTGIYTPCPHTGYTSRPCGHGHGLDK
jgi:hypothetical protein